MYGRKFDTDDQIGTTEAVLLSTMSKSLVALRNVKNRFVPFSAPTHRRGRRDRRTILVHISTYTVTYGTTSGFAIANFAPFSPISGPDILSRPPGYGPESRYFGKINGEGSW